jgi:hypothetical protein
MVQDARLWPFQPLAQVKPGLWRAAGLNPRKNNDRILHQG